MASSEVALTELKKIVELFQSKELPKIASKAYLTGIGTPSESWSFNNRLLMIFVGQTFDARGYRQWQEAGRNVKKGAKAFYILAPVLKTIKEKNEETGEEEERKIIIGFRGVPVFRIEDTEITDQAKWEANQNYKPKVLPPLIDVAKKWGIEIRYSRTVFGEYGSYNPETNQIRLCTDSVVTFFHELAHAAHKKIDGNLKAGQDPEQETIAQLSAAVLGRLYGAQEDNYSWNYIAHYAGSHTPEAVGKLCLKVLSKVEKILKLILEEQETVAAEGRELQAPIPA